MRTSLCLPVKLYFDIDINAHTNKNFDSKSLVDKLVNIFVLRCNNMFDLHCTPENAVILDSSNEHKLSYHVIFREIVFSNNQMCKRFIQQVLNDLSPEDLSKLTVLDKYEKSVPAVDLSVYNRNQCFREVIVKR